MSPVEVLEVELDGAATEQTLAQVAALLAGDLATRPNPGQLTDTGLAGQDLGGHRVVTPNQAGRYVYPTTAEQALSRALFVTSGAALNGQAVTVVTQGIVDEQSWTWAAPTKLYLGAGGQLTPSVAGMFGVLAPLAVAVSPTRIIVRQFSPIALT